MKYQRSEILDYTGSIITTFGLCPLFIKSLNYKNLNFDKYILFRNIIIR